MRLAINYLTLFLLLLVVTGFTVSCEKIDINEDDSSAGTSSTDGINQIRPTSLGNGTQESPFSPDHILLGQVPSDTTCWFIGYVVGSTFRSMDNANFTSETTYTANVLISSNPTCDTISLCVPVEITSASVRKVLSLADNPDRFQQCAMIYATTERYLNRQGLRKVTSAYWLPDFSIRNIDSSPEQWKEESF